MMASHSFLTFFVLIFLLLIVRPSSAISVLITNGTVIGVDDAANGVQKFLGIPFAEPPVGDLRLRQAISLRESFGNFQADTFGPSCFSARDQGNSSEDCLTLNIWRPTNATSSSSRLPVLVWLYGGGLTNGFTAGYCLLCDTDF